MSLAGVVPVAAIATKWGVTARCAKRRLKKLNARAPGLLVQFGDRGHWFADIAMLRIHLPGLLLEEGGPLERLLGSSSRIEKMVEELHHAIVVA